MTPTFAEVLAARDAADLKAVAEMKHGHGVRLLARIIFRYGQLEEAAVAPGADGRIDPLWIAVREGRRHMAREILTDLRAIDADLALSVYEARFESLEDAALLAKEKPDAR